MTLSECVDRLRTRVEIDLESEVDLSDSNVAARHLVRGAQSVTRDTHVLYESGAALTLAQGDRQINLLGSQCAYRIYRVGKDGIYINGGWLCARRMQEFYDSFPDYLTASQGSPSDYTAIKDDTVLLSLPLSSAVAAAPAYVRGWREHQPYTWASNQNTEMEGPQEYHLLYVDRTALDISKSYVSGVEAQQRRAFIQADLDKKVAKFAANNLNAFTDNRRPGLAGTTRRFFTLGRTY